jgi:hypothetical protein
VVQNCRVQTAGRQLRHPCGRTTHLHQQHPLRELLQRVSVRSIVTSVESGGLI